MPSKTSSIKSIRLSRADQKTKRAEEIRSAAWTLFCEKGYEGTTMEEVAEHAGVTRHPVFYTFGDKQTLFLELWKTKVADSIAQATPHMKKGAFLRDNLQTLAKLMAGESGATDHELHSLFFVIQTIALSRPDIQQKLKAISASVPEFLTEVVETSKLDAGERLRAPAKIVAAALVGFLHGIATVRYQTDEFTLDWRHLFDIFQSIALERSPR